MNERVEQSTATLHWQKSSYSGSDGGNCVEAAGVGGQVHLRDSKFPAGPLLSVPDVAWRDFTRSLAR